MCEPTTTWFETQHITSASGPGSNAGWILSPDEAEELLPRPWILQERPAHAAVGHVRVVLDAAPLCAEVVRFQHDGDAIWPKRLLQKVRELHDRLFLDLRPAHHPVGDAGEFREPDEVRILVWQ